MTPDLLIQNTKILAVMDFIFTMYFARYPLPRFIQLVFQYIIIAIMIYNFIETKKWLLYFC